MIIDLQGAATKHKEKAKHGGQSYGLQHNNKIPKHGLNQRQSEIKRPVKGRESGPGPGPGPV